MASGGNDGWCDCGTSVRGKLFLRSQTAPRLAFSARLLAIGTGGDEFVSDGAIVKLWDYVPNEK